MLVTKNATVCSPIKNLSDLFNVSKSNLANRFQCSPLVPRHTSPRQKVLLCHDMRGGYLEDKHTQGCQTNEPCYRFSRWHLIDLFVYFAHELVTVPPLVWIDCAHRNGVQILGTFITEFDAGKEICRQLLASDDAVDRAVEALVLLMAWYRFDGYLLNIENPIEPEYVERLLSFVSKLKRACSDTDRNSVVLWYDSVTINGELKWQNQLNELNQCTSFYPKYQPYFNACDGIFLNYGWKSESLLQSKINAGERHRDVFIGIDVFGRGCFGGGGFNTCEAMAVSHTADLSTAIFAPGWLFETLDVKQFVENDRKFWNLLEPYTSQRVLHLKSLTTFFSDGFGEKFFLHGLEVASNAWYNLSLQSYLPNTLNESTWSIKHDDAYFGGSYLELEGNMGGYFKLFKCLIPVQSACDVTIVFKSSDDVVLELTGDNGSLICFDNCEEDFVIRQWRRKTYRLTVNDGVSITDISIRSEKSTGCVIKLGYLSIRPTPSSPNKIEHSLSLIQSIVPNGTSSMTLHFVDLLQDEPSSIILIFARDPFDRYSFLGATRQSYFVIYQSTAHKDKAERSTLVIRHYHLDSLELIREQLLPIPIASHCLKGFCSEESS